MTWKVRSATAAIAVVGCLSATLSAQAVLSRLGVAGSDANERFLAAVQDGSWPGVGVRAFLALAPAARAAAVTEVAAWAKTYYGSAAFKKAWAEHREANKPDPPTPPPDAAQQNATQDKQIEEMKKLAATMPPDQRKAFEESIKQMEAAMRDPAVQAQQASMARQAGGIDQKRYQEAVATWQQEYPVDPTPLLVKRLHDFLAQTADVDFDAKLGTRDGMKYFANPQYESKPSQWKMAFRAGREATTAARAAATTWLKELGQ